MRKLTTIRRYGHRVTAPMKLTRLITIWTVLISFLFSSSAQAATYYFHNDQLGTPQVVTDQSQTVVWQGEYDPFGEVTEAVAKVEQNLRFPGQYLDRETGLHYNYFRTYDPGIGRYTQSDPIGLVGGISTYGYAYQNPNVYTDPTGELVPAVWWGATALWAAFEVAGSAYDLYDTVNTFADECSSTTDKVVAGGLYAAGILLPGAGYSKIDDGAKKVGTNRNPNKLSPDPDAAGSHSSFRRGSDGRTTNYETYDRNPRTDEWGASKRFRGVGKAHGGVEPPLVLDRPPGKGPGSRPTVPRKTESWELPNGY